MASLLSCGERPSMYQAIWRKDTDERDDESFTNSSEQRAVPSWRYKPNLKSLAGWVIWNLLFLMIS